jgi:hypothetical protein
MVNKKYKVKLNSPRAKPGIIKGEPKSSIEPISTSTEGGFGDNARNSEVQQVNRDPERPHT